MKKPKPPRHRMHNPLKPRHPKPQPGRGVRVPPPQLGGRPAPVQPGRGRRMTNPLVPGAPAAKHHHHAKKHPKRKLSLGDVACCSAEALAASLRLLGVPVGGEDVLALYWRTAADPDAGATLSDTLEAASEFGLAGVRLTEFRERPLQLLGCSRGQHHGELEVGHELNALPDLGTKVADDLGCVDLDWLHATEPTPLILGVDLPGSHALAVGPDGAWWSWGEPYCPCSFPDAVIEEAWLVDWEA